MFNYGNNNPSLLTLEMGAHQHSLHGEDSYFINDNAFGVADGGIMHCIHCIVLFYNLSFL